MLRKYYYPFLILLVALSACNKKDELLSNQQGLPVSFDASVFQGIQTRVIGTEWESGDKIGVFAIKNGTNLNEGSIVENYDNFSFSTSGNGQFFQDSQAIYYPEDGSAIDFISYYPYKPNLTSYNYPIDIADQVDLLYSNNLKNATKVNTNNTLEFNRALSKLVITIEPKGSGSLQGLSIEIEGLKTKASFSLVDGKLTVDDTAMGNLLLSPTGTNTKKQVTTLLLPTTEENSIKVLFKIGDKVTYKWTIPHVLEGGSLYSYHINLNGLTSDVTPATSYMEIPYYTSGGEAPNSQIIFHMVGNNSWLNGYNGPNTDSNTQRNYSILYDIENHIPYWIAFPMHPIYLGSTKRTNAWGYDPEIATVFQPDIVNKSFPGGVYNRGHMLASGDRTSSRDINKTTFYASNMVPQNIGMNSGVWNNLEERVRYWCNETKYDTLYVVTGSILPPEGQFTYNLDNSGKQVAVPKYLYKALLKQDKSSKEWHSIAFKMENNNANISYINSIVSVVELEEETGFTFFPNLANATEVKKQKSLTHWN